MLCEKMPSLIASIMNRSINLNFAIKDINPNSENLQNNYNSKFAKKIIMNTSSLLTIANKT